jgi:hypothetical protein
MLNGWGGYVLTEANYVNAFFSHDEYIDFFVKDSENLTDIRKVLGPSQPPPVARQPRGKVGTSGVAARESALIRGGLRFKLLSGATTNRILNVVAPSCAHIF